MTKWILAALTVLALASPTAALAEPTPTAEGDLAIARTYWGREPNGCSSITFTTEVLGGDDLGGEATEPTPGVPPVPCRIAVREVWSTPGQSPVMACIFAVHEWGHLLGEGHSPDPGSVMYFQPRVSSVPACENPVETAEGQEEVRRQQGWQTWRELRSECIVSRSPFRRRCWQMVSHQAKRLRTTLGV
jgi:hypothetical protein